MHNPKASILICGMAISGVAAPASRAESIGDRFLTVARDGKSSVTLVAPAERTPIWDASIGMIAGTAQRWSGTALPVVRLATDAPLPAGDLILLATPDTNKIVALMTEQPETTISRVPFVNDHGFGIETRTADGSRQLILAGKTPRGAYNAAVYCRDFLLDATAPPAGRAEVFVRGASVLRSPRLTARGTYHLSIYGEAMKYTAEDWMKIIDRNAEDGMDRVYFWLSGHHPSKKYPQLYDVDATKGTKLTVDGVQRLIRHCHDRQIQFYIGGGVFAWVAADYIGQGHPEIRAVKAGGLCPCKPYARTGTMEHYLEMLETWPEADGFMLEIRDEHHECMCPECQVPIDEFGSKNYGRAEITWLQELARQAWKRNPKLRFCWLIGYAEHAKDVYYYDQIRQMNDPRFEWLDARVSLDKQGEWTLPGPGGKPRPLAFFGQQIIHWDPFYKQEIRWLLNYAQRSASEGLYGYVPAFEPGFGSASYYSDQIPLPVDLLPYCLTGFVYREVTWNPGMSMNDLRDLIHRRYFSPDAPRRFTEDMIYLRQFSISHSDIINAFAAFRHDYVGRAVPPANVKQELDRVRAMRSETERKAAAEQLLGNVRRLAAIEPEFQRMSDIEAAIKDASPAASRKTLDGFEILTRMIRDTRALYAKAVPEPAALPAMVRELKALGPATQPTR